MLSTSWTRQLTDAQLSDVRGLLLAARDVDGHPEVTADGPLPGELRGGWQLLASDPAGELVGYAHLDTEGDSYGRQVAELIVRPSRRREGHGAELLRAVVDKAELPEGQGDRLRIWSHGDHPGAAKLAERFDLTRARELVRMRLDFATAPALPELASPEGVRLTTFQPGVDEESLIAVNAAAFDWHPEQGALTVAELRETEAADWFDPAGLFLAWSGADLVGFHWTKVHPPSAEFGGEPVGEVYVVGVAPGRQGGGLGKALTLAGLHHLRERGLGQVILYVEGDNGPAMSVYRRLGFQNWDIGVQYAR
ncbi:mycothiol synthase [Tamaricihabitans halophyticus]|uniref:Mycothiol acetyltransferase n=1 Tax=Tamaricihabitans halophyticus TaxID=1262583 RepID=A0A4R2QY90_9PSEU|nr:mycothiol synthase [Tamaricihabitans halophyticus]TCP54364.1 mycothiol synthase [Tamaricihabitans halophyticus]